MLQGRKRQLSGEDEICHPISREIFGIIIRKKLVTRIRELFKGIEATIEATTAAAKIVFEGENVRDAVMWVLRDLVKEGHLLSQG